MMRHLVYSMFTVGVLLATGGAARAAGPAYWDWPADRSFDEVQLEGAAVGAEGHLVAGLTTRILGPDGPEVAWTAVPDGHGGYFTGTGHGGEIHHVAGDGESRVFASLEATEIFALLRLPGGDLLAGCGPEGHLFRIDGDGAVTVEGTIEGGYVWALGRDEETGQVWVATGSPAEVHRYDPRDRTLTRVAALDALNALDVMARPGGEVLVATQGPGLVFRIDARGNARLVHETAQDEARQFIVGPGGDVFLLALRNAEDADAAAMASLAPAPPPALLALLGGEPGEETPAAVLYRIGDGDVVETWWSGQDELLTAAWSPRWGWLAGGPLDDDDDGATLMRLVPPRGQHVLAGWEGGDVLQILVDGPEREPLAVCQAHPGAVVALGDDGGRDRVALSPPLDGGHPVRWGRLTWRGEAPGGKLKWSVRGGNRSVPDGTWTAWSDSWSEADHAVDLPPCRFLQWRVVFPSGRKAEGARVTAVSVSAWQDNLAPVIGDFEQEHLKDIQVGGMMNGTENVTQRFRSGLQAEFTRGVTSDPWAGPVRGAIGRSLRIFTWQGSDPNGDRLAYRLEQRRLGAADWTPLQTARPGEYETSETLLAWDTSGVADGRYEVRLTASDHPDNPGDLARESSRSVGPVVVDNTPPAVSGFALERTAGGFRITARVEDATSPLAGARVWLPNGMTERVDPRDRICDSLREDFAADVSWPREGLDPGSVPWRVRLEVRDLAGNLKTVEGVVR